MSDLIKTKALHAKVAIRLIYNVDWIIVAIAARTNE